MTPTLADMQAAAPRCQVMRSMPTPGGYGLRKLVPCYGRMRYEHRSNLWRCTDCGRATAGVMLGAIHDGGMPEAA